MLIHDRILVAVLRPPPPTRPWEAAISSPDFLAKTRATMARMMGQTIHEVMASTKPTMAFVDVVGAGA